MFDEEKLQKIREVFNTSLGLDFPLEKIRIMVNEYIESFENNDGLSGKYFSDQENVIEKLYSPCLEWATHYVRDAGYFSSNVYHNMSKQILEFILRDSENHITMITCIDLRPSDFDAIVDEPEKSNEEVIEELKKMLEDPVLSDPVKMLAALVASGQMTVYVSLRKRDPTTPYALDHSKSGYFTNGEKTVVFDGSINETFPATHPVLRIGNKEHFNIYANWELKDLAYDLFAVPVIERLQGDIEGQFYDGAKESSGDGTIIVEVKSLSREQLPAIDDKDWDPTNHKERAAKRTTELYNKFEKIISEAKKLGKAPMGDDSEEIDESVEDDKGDESEEIAESVEDEEKPKKLRDHQEKGLNLWMDSGCKGILSHATGSGKTFTALTEIKKHAEQGFPVLILVPSRLLLEQWIKEIKEYLPDAGILPVGSGYNEWKELLGFWTHDDPINDRLRITVAINDSARTEKFAQRISKNMQNLLLVVDECHRIGAPSFSEICKWTPNKVLGLSATPERYDEGITRLHNLCGPIIHEYGLEQAILDGHLTKYVYNVERVSMSYDENNDYQKLKEEISESIRKMKRGKDGKINFAKMPAWLRIKLIEAKRIIKKAEEKTFVCGEIIKQNYKPKDLEYKENWLVYCEDGKQLASVRDELERREVSPIFEYWTGAEGAILGPQDDPKSLEFDRDGTIKAWEREGGVLLSIQCLDEGVNIPQISHGIILASSNNPRQFIQRRGRMLRKSKGKQFAYIWDTLVVPDNQQSSEYENYILGEIKRADIFARNSIGGNAKLELINLKSNFSITDEVESIDVEESAFDD